MRAPLRHRLARTATRGALLACCAGMLNGHAQEQKKAPPAPPPPKPKPAQIAAPPYPPNEIDLKAAYCRPVVAASTAEHQRASLANSPPMQQQAAKERLAASIDRTRRLEFYLLPRLNTLQPAGLLDAQGRGYTDVASLLELTRTCETKCSNAGDAAAVTTCRLRCRDGSEAGKRARECDDISWLPLKDP